jgi:hypothetical protein
MTTGTSNFMGMATVCRPKLNSTQFKAIQLLFLKDSNISSQIWNLSEDGVMNIFVIVYKHKSCNILNNVKGD